MATDYAIRCVVHYDGNDAEPASWPRHAAARRWQLPALDAVVRNRAVIVGTERAFADLGLSVVIDMLGAPGEFLAAHEQCDLAIFDEYGAAVTDAG